MDTNDMVIFREVATLASISHAALKLGYVQSNVSKRIEKIETELNHKLFLRTNKGMKLLPEGEQFLVYCNQILTVMDEIYTNFSIETKKVRIGATQTISKNYLSRAFLLDNLSIHTASVTELFSFLKQAFLDFIIINREITDNLVKEFYSFQEKICWSQSTNELSELNEKSIIISRDTKCPYRKATQKYIAEYNIEPNKLIQVDTFDILLSMIENGQAIGIVPQKILNQNPKLKQLPSHGLDSVKISLYSLTQNKQSYDFKKMLDIFD